MAQHEIWSAERTARILEDHAGVEGSLLPILHAVQDAFGYVPDPAVPQIAAALHWSRAEVYGVLTFYHDFRREPAGRHVLKICRAEACQSRGSDALAAQAQQRLGIAFGATTADERVTLEPVYCLGLCALGPSAMLDGRVVARLNTPRMEALLAEAQR